MPGSPDSPWRYGVAHFPLPPLLSLLAVGSLRVFVSVSGTEPFSDADALVGLAAFLLTTLSFWLAVLVAVVVAGSVYLDARALAGRGTWSPNQYVFAVVGLVHLAATELLVLNLLSVPAFLYYVYRRRRHVS